MLNSVRTEIYEDVINHAWSVTLENSSFVQIYYSDVRSKLNNKLSILHIVMDTVYEDIDEICN